MNPILQNNLSYSSYIRSLIRTKVLALPNFYEKNSNAVHRSTLNLKKRKCVNVTDRT